MIRPFLKLELTRKIFSKQKESRLKKKKKSYVADLGINDDMDPGVFVIAWKLGCATPWVLSKTEWMNGWSQQGASTVAEMKAKLAGWRKDLEDNKVWKNKRALCARFLRSEQVFTVFYNWVFDHMRGDKRILDWEQTKVLRLSVVRSGC